MAAESSTWLAVIEESYQFYTAVFGVYVICMGLVRWHAKSVWRKLEVVRRDKQKLPVAAFASSGGSDGAFESSTLYQGGLLGVVVVAILLLYVVFMLAFFHGPALHAGRSGTPELLASVSILIFFPILGIPFFIFMVTAPKRSGAFYRDAAATIAVIALSVLAAFVGRLFLRDDGLVVTIECIVVIVLSLCLSYSIGALEGISAADPTKLSPLVSIERHDGSKLDEVWLYGRTDVDYRFLTKNGVNHIVPAVNVKSITLIT